MSRYNDGATQQGGTDAGVHVADDDLDGIDPEIDLTVSAEKREQGLDYVSKSRVKKYKECPAEFYFKYWCEHRPPGTYYTDRGSQVHETYEIFHENLIEYIDQHGEKPERWTSLLPDDYELWSQWLEPYIDNFWRFEERRWDVAQNDVILADAMMAEHSTAGVDIDRETLNMWQPIEVEAEAWLGEPPEDRDVPDDAYINPDGPPVGDIPWMGSADAILHSASVPGVDGTGVVILDYKTGSVPDKQYRDDGIFLEGEYYGVLFEKFFDIDAVAGYYPQSDKLIVSPYPSQERRFDIRSAALGMQKMPEMVDEGDVPPNFPINELPLCHYGHGKCWFYDVCPSGWNAYK